LGWTAYGEGPGHDPQISDVYLLVVVKVAFHPAVWPHRGAEVFGENGEVLAVEAAIEVGVAVDGERHHDITGEIFDPIAEAVAGVAFGVAGGEDTAVDAVSGPGAVVVAACQVLVNQRNGCQLAVRADAVVAHVEGAATVDRERSN